jgi:DNA-directed RNA polymerase subunit RPC12/RpoP
MPAVTVQKQNERRFVRCRTCGKPIRLSASLAKRQSVVESEDAVSEFTSRVFPARCRTCLAEAIYALHEIDCISCDSRG